ncbi:MOSC domain-containing protein [Streptomyces johnsoniae]|uniref:MOSC domain-containing protein n=1 Tax=Streptomyces johnsoniae TaxID=3075532 RepID=A0ABU2S5L0_9ACTN|nr:MOSC N-terminal beta barrel domain-containing protein [Streptomyces sp. DSM 41886]MDT0444220.1 MOSC domain-containing protein [Streptomyces sp. DSM 41886]
MTQVADAATAGHAAGAARVTALWTYPVKGCAGMPLTAARVGPAGLPHDRVFMVTDAAGTFRSQRADPLLAAIRPVVDAAGEVLTLHGGEGPVEVPVDLDGEPRPVRLFGRPFRGIDQGEAVAAWLTAVLGSPSRLVHVPRDHGRVTDGETPGTSGYADSSAVHLTTESSLADLNARIAAAGRAPVPMTRFRPNIVVDDLGGPYGEDAARRVAAGAARLAYAKPAVRCAVTLVDQRDGARAGPEPLRTLAGYRRTGEGGVTFGVKFSVPDGGALAVGDALLVTARAEP